METVSCQWDSHPLLWQFCGWESDKSNFERKASHRENPDDDDAPVGHTPDDLAELQKTSPNSRKSAFTRNKPRASGRKGAQKFPDRVSCGPARRQNSKTPVVVFRGVNSGLGSTPALRQPF